MKIALDDFEFIFKPVSSHSPIGTRFTDRRFYAISKVYIVDCLLSKNARHKIIGVYIILSEKEKWKENWSTNDRYEIDIINKFN